MAGQDSDMALSSLPAGRQVARSNPMMYHVYILRNESGRHYIGMSADTIRRLADHNSGKVKSTKPYRPWTIIHSERYSTRVKARRREVELKTNFSEREKILRK
jgi:putative endonuclease